MSQFKIFKNHLKYLIHLNYLFTRTKFKMIKERITTRWGNCEETILLILTVPAECSDKEKVFMRECALNAGLIEDKYSENLQFITERK
jgi:hypothetical protein